MRMMRAAAAIGGRWLRGRVTLLLGLAVTAGLLGCGSAPPAKAPRPWDNLAPLNLDEPPDRLTALRLKRLDDRPEECEAILALSGAATEPVPDRNDGGGCGWRSAVRVSRTLLQTRAPFVLSCRATVTLLLWERHVVAPAALRHFGEPATGLDHMGTYACRAVGAGSTSSGRLSRHGRADAIDIGGFRLRSGRRIQVLGGWHGEADEAAFLREVHTGACRYFDVVLGPDNDASHANHLHLDRGDSRYCR